MTSLEISQPVNTINPINSMANISHNRKHNTYNANKHITSNKTSNKKTPIITCASVNQESKKYGARPHVIHGKILNEPTDTYEKGPIDTQRLINILQGTIPIQQMDYCKTVDIKIALDRDENGEVSHLTPKEMLLSLSLLKFYNNFRNLYIFAKIVNGDSPISLRLIEYFVVNYVVDHDTVYNIIHYKSNPSYLIQLLNPTPKSKKSTNANTNANTNTNTNTITNTMMNITINNSNNMKNHAQRNIMGNELDAMRNFDNYILAHDKYKAQLKEYSKLSFDPFCRSTRICRGSNVSRNSRISLVLPGNVSLSTTVAQMNFFKWAINDHIIEYILDNQTIIDAAMSEYENSKNITTMSMVPSDINNIPNTYMNAINNGGDGNNKNHIDSNNIMNDDVDNNSNGDDIDNSKFDVIDVIDVNEETCTLDKQNIDDIKHTKRLNRKKSKNNKEIDLISVSNVNSLHNTNITNNITYTKKTNINLNTDKSPSAINELDILNNNDTIDTLANDNDNDNNNNTGTIDDSVNSDLTVSRARRRRRGRESKQSVTRYTCRRIIKFD